MTRQTPKTHSVEVDRDRVPQPVEAETYHWLTQTDPSACPISGIDSVPGRRPSHRQRRTPVPDCRGPRLDKARDQRFPTRSRQGSIPKLTRSRDERRYADRGKNENEEKLEKGMTTHERNVARGPVWPHVGIGLSEPVFLDLVPKGAGRELQQVRSLSLVSSRAV